MREVREEEKEMLKVMEEEEELLSKALDILDNRANMITEFIVEMKVSHQDTTGMKAKNDELITAIHIIRQQTGLLP